MLRRWSPGLPCCCASAAHYCASCRGRIAQLDPVPARVSALSEHQTEAIEALDDGRGHLPLPAPPPMQPLGLRWLRVLAGWRSRATPVTMTGLDCHHSAVLPSPRSSHPAGFAPWSRPTLILVNAQGQPTRSASTTLRRGEGLAPSSNGNESP